VGVRQGWASALRGRWFELRGFFLGWGPTRMGHNLIVFSRHYFGPLGQGRREVGFDGTGTTRDAMEPADPAVGPADLARQSDIDGVIDRLPTEHRDLFHALYYLGLSQSDAADVFEISLSTLKRRWVEARDLFLERYGYDLA